MSLARAAVALVFLGSVADADDHVVAPVEPSPGEVAPATAAEAECDRALAMVGLALREDAYLDGHLLAQVARLRCDRYELDAFDAIALAHLDEGERARARLGRWRRGEHAGAAGVIEAWTFWREGDATALARLAAALPASERARLDAFSAPSAAAIDRALAGEPRVLAQDALRRRAAARQRRPWLAGLLSAVVPGSGQVYAGSLESGAIAFALNALAIGATVELAGRELYASAALAGTVGSMFYVGNIGSAIDLARRRNQLAQAPADADLRRALLPEVYP